MRQTSRVRPTAVTTSRSATTRRGLLASGVTRSLPTCYNQAMSSHTLHALQSFVTGSPIWVEWRKLCTSQDRSKSFTNSSQPCVFTPFESSIFRSTTSSSRAEAPTLNRSAKREMTKSTSAYLLELASKSKKYL